MHTAHKHHSWPPIWYLLQTLLSHRSYISLNGALRGKGPYEIVIINQWNTVLQHIFMYCKAAACSNLLKEEQRFISEAVDVMM